MPSRFADAQGGAEGGREVNSCNWKESTNEDLLYHKLKFQEKVKNLRASLDEAGYQLNSIRSEIKTRTQEAARADD